MTTSRVEFDSMKYWRVENCLLFTVYCPVPGPCKEGGNKEIKKTNCQG